jgi:hypothetical protein
MKSDKECAWYSSKYLSAALNGISIKKRILLEVAVACIEATARWLTQLTWRFFLVSANLPVVVIVINYEGLSGYYSILQC